MIFYATINDVAIWFYAAYVINFDFGHIIKYKTLNNCITVIYGILMLPITTCNIVICV